MKKIRKDFNWDGKTVRLIEMLLDLFIILSIYVFSVIAISDFSIRDLLDGSIVTRDLAISVFIISLGVVFLFRIYNITITKRGYISTMFSLVISLFIISVITLLFSLINVTYSLPKMSLGLMGFMQFFSLAILKGFGYLIIKRFNLKYCLIIGKKHDVDILVKKVLYDDNKFIVIKYLVYEDAEKFDVSKVYEYIDSVDYVYITENLSTERKNLVISYCFKISKTIYLVPQLYELSINKARVTQVSDTLVYEINSLELTFEQRLLKRLFDLVFSFVLIIITLPIMLMVSLSIKIFDGGKIFYKQERVTINNKKFVLYKFRTMINDAEKDTGPVLTAENDSRVTKIGRILRRLRLDELPQLLNILKGEMSVVGPRPEREHFIRQFIEENKDYQYRSNVKAGVTGLAQALGTYNTNFNEKLRFDIYYITNYSFLNDLYILLYTIRSVFNPKSSKGISLDKSSDCYLEKEGFHILKTDDPGFYLVFQK